MIFDKLAPILLFVYQRPEHTRRTLEALSKNSLANKSTLYIYADGAKVEAESEDINKVIEVRKVIKEQQWCKEVHIIEASTNKGLADSIIDGVTEKVNEHGRVIVLEDDLITSEGFLQYMNDALKRYAAEEKVMQISGYQFPINAPYKESSFFLSVASSWGWATWQRAWKHFDPLSIGYEQLKTDENLSKRFDLNGSYPYSSMLINQIEKKNIDSWAIRWWWSIFKCDGLSLFPDISLVENIGYGKDASHTKGYDPFKAHVLQSGYYINSFPREIKVNLTYSLRLQQFLRKKDMSNFNGVMEYLRQYIHKIYNLFN